MARFEDDEAFAEEIDAKVASEPSPPSRLAALAALGDKLARCSSLQAVYREACAWAVNVLPASRALLLSADGADILSAATDGAVADLAISRAMLDRVGLPERQFPLSRYPHELSGGQRQRVVIAIACALQPKLLVADKPTTALDVVLQAQILDLLRDLVDERKMGLLLISHDLAVVADMADRVSIMRHGEVLATGETGRIMTEKNHPYTRQLAEASMHVPERQRKFSPRPLAAQVGQSPSYRDAQAAPLLSVENVTRDYAGRRRSLFAKAEPFRAVKGVSFSLHEGQSMALVGRSGCGKSTLARMILALDKPTTGLIRFLDEELTEKSQAELRRARLNMQVVFQDPYGSFNPRHKGERLVAEPLHLLQTQPSRDEKRERVVQALQEVGLTASDID